MAAGTVAVNIVANTRGFTKGLKSARTELKGFGGFIQRNERSILRWSGVISGTAVAAAAGLTHELLSTNDELNKIGKTARKLDMNPEQLQFFRFAAERAGISVSTMEMAMQRMVRRIGQASLGMGEARKTIEQFGLSAEDLVKLSPDKQFELISKHLNAIENNGEKLAAAMSFFDSEGVGLVNLAAEDLGKLRQEFERFGGAASNESVANAEAFADAMTNLSQVAGSFKRDFIIDITPAAVKGIDEITRLLDIVQGRDTQRPSGVRRFIGGYLETVGNIASAVSGGRVGGSHQRAGRNIRMAATSQADLNRQFQQEMLVNPDGGTGLIAATRNRRAFQSRIEQQRETRLEKDTKTKGDEDLQKAIEEQTSFLADALDVSTPEFTLSPPLF